ncbi:MAG: hypothetical protein M3R35_06280 [Candidatus Eremiobacteraeota bacterium]|nr:hypothetical protein [Candidatus Eremiobacteraeota bacterium]
MQLIARHFTTRARGQAMTESVIMLPLFLLVLYAVIWTVQSGVVNERVQVAVRYSGLVSNESSPYAQYSLYALYTNLEGSTPPVPSCVAPTSDALLNSGQFPGPTTSAFWKPVGVANGTCASGNVTMQGNGLLQPLVFTHTLSSITAQTPVEGVLKTALGTSTQQVDASQNYLDAPGIGTMLSCFSEIDATVSASLQDTAPAIPQDPAPLPDINPTTPLTLSGGC